MKEKEDDFQRLFGRKKQPKPAKSYRKSIYRGLAAFIMMSVIVFAVLIGSKDDIAVKLLMSVAIGGVIGYVIGFLHFKLVHE